MAAFILASKMAAKLSFQASGIIIYCLLVGLKDGSLAAIGKVEY